jgi:hypothetical protein
MRIKKKTSSRNVPRYAPHDSTPPVFYWDLAALDAWSAKQTMRCPKCGVSLSLGKPEEATDHLLTHEWPDEMHADLTRRRAILRDWDTFPVGVQRRLLAPTIASLWSDPTTFEELQRAGVVAQVRKG